MNLIFSLNLPYIIWKNLKNSFDFLSFHMLIKNA